MSSKIKMMQDFTQGDEFFVKIQYLPTIDITGYSFKLTLKLKDSDTTPALQITHAVGSGDDDPAGGICYIPLTGTETDGLVPGRYWGELQVTDSNGSRVLLRSGLNNVDRVTVFKKLT